MCHPKLHAHTRFRGRSELAEAPERIEDGSKAKNGEQPKSEPAPVPEKASAPPPWRQASPPKPTTAPLSYTSPPPPPGQSWVERATGQAASTLSDVASSGWVDQATTTLSDLASSVSSVLPPLSVPEPPPPPSGGPRYPGGLSGSEVVSAASESPSLSQPAEGSLHFPGGEVDTTGIRYPPSAWKGGRPPPELLKTEARGTKADIDVAGSVADRSRTLVEQVVGGGGGEEESPFSKERYPPRALDPALLAMAENMRVHHQPAVREAKRARSAARSSRGSSLAREDIPASEPRPFFVDPYEAEPALPDVRARAGPTQLLPPHVGQISNSLRPRSASQRC